MKTHYIEMAISNLQDRVARAEASRQLREILGGADRARALEREVASLARESLERERELARLQGEISYYKSVAKCDGG